MRLPALTLLLCAAGCGPALRAPRAPGADPVLTVVSYNLNFGLAGDLPTLAAIGTDADLVVLQETTPEWEVAIRAAYEGHYPYMAFRHCCRAGGLAVLSRRPLGTPDPLPNPEGFFPALRILAQTPVGLIQVLAVHLRPMVSDSGSWVVGYFTTDDERVREAELFAGALQPEIPTLIAGDFNEAADGEAVAYFRARGWRSALPEFHGDEATWRWPTVFGEVTHQLDHILYGPELIPLNAEVLRRGRSDHLPVRATFELRGEGEETR